jgi:hypothetical protein
VTTEDKILYYLSSGVPSLYRELVRSMARRKDFITTYHDMILHSQLEQSGTGKPGDPIMVKLISQARPRSTPAEHSHRLIDLVGRPAVLDLIARIDASSEADIADHIRKALYQYKPNNIEEIQ